MRVTPHSQASEKGQIPERGPVIPAEAGIQEPWEVKDSAKWTPAPFGYRSEPALSVVEWGRLRGNDKPGPGTSKRLSPNGECHGEERSDEAISIRWVGDCFAPLAMTCQSVVLR